MFFDRINPTYHERNASSYIVEDRPRRMYADEDHRANFYEEGFRSRSSAILFEERTPTAYRYENQHHRSQNYENSIRQRNYN
jgi:hypothetical protein